MRPSRESVVGIASGVAEQMIKTWVEVHDEERCLYVTQRSLFFLCVFRRVLLAQLLRQSRALERLGFVDADANGGQLAVERTDCRPRRCHWRVTVGVAAWRWQRQWCRRCHRWRVSQSARRRTACRHGGRPGRVGGTCFALDVSFVLAGFDHVEFRACVYVAGSSTIRRSAKNATQQPLDATNSKSTLRTL